jgi:hypothetical protein
LAAYPKETVIAEKYQAMVMLGMANSRMKDFYDLWILARDFAFQGKPLSRAIQATFHKRQTALPKQLPLAMTAEFYADDGKRKQWQGFIRKSKLDTEGVGLDEIAVVLQIFLMPPTQALIDEVAFTKGWKPGGIWE